MARCRSLMATPSRARQNSALRGTPALSSRAASMARLKQARNHASHAVMSSPPFLGAFHDGVEVRALPPDLAGHTVEPLGRSFRAREGLVGDGAGDPSVAVEVDARIEGDDHSMSAACGGGR